MPSRWTRRLLSFVGVVVGVLILLHLVNVLRPGPSGMFSGAAPIIERAVAMQEVARSEYQDLALARLPPNPLNGPFVRLDDDLERATLMLAPTAAKSAGNDTIHAFEFNGGGGGFVAAAGMTTTELRDGVLVVRSDAKDWLVSELPLGVPRDDLGQIVMRLRADKGLFLRLGWVGENATPEEQAEPFYASLDVRFSGSPNFQDYVINARDFVKRRLQPGERLGKLYIQASDADGAVVEIDYIRFLSKITRYVGQNHGRDYEVFGGERRQVMFMWPDQTLRFDIEVPLDDPLLTFGTAVLLRDRPLQFAVDIDAANVVSRLHDARIEEPEAWRDVRVDLSPWAGRRVGVSLTVRGDPLTVGFWSSPLVSSRPLKPFNVIFLVEDAQRADYLSLYGNTRKTTPFKDQLFAQEGIVFNRAISQATKTRPSVASLMTSLYPTANGLWYFSDVLNDRFLTLAEILRAQGFITASFTQNGNAGTYAGIGQGFDQLFEGAAVGRGTEGVFDSEEVRRWLRTHKDRNFFLYLHAIDPHAVYDPPSPFRETYAALIPEQVTPIKRSPGFDADWVETPSVESRRLLYQAEIAHNDSVVPQLLRTLADLGLRRDTLVVMLSDHGEWMGEHDLLGNRLWDHKPPGRMEVTHVPLTMLYPPMLSVPRRIDVPVQLLDVMPTVLELARVDRSGLMLQGQSLVGLLEGTAGDAFDDRIVISEEPTAMLKDNPCACGSLHAQGWQINSSSWAWPRGASRYPNLLAFAGTTVYAIEDNSRPTMLWSYMPDLYLRWRQRSVLSALREANLEIWRRISEGSSAGGLIDPDTLDRLKGLGYIN